MYNNYFHCYSWLGVLIYWLFLFIVVVVLLNILIAQFSKSYEEETERAQINVILTRTEIIIKTEQSVITHHFVGVSIEAFQSLYFHALHRGWPNKLRSQAIPHTHYEVIFLLQLVRRIRKKLMKKSMEYERVERLNLTGYYTMHNTSLCHLNYQVIVMKRPLSIPLNPSRVLVWSDATIIMYQLNHHSFCHSSCSVLYQNPSHTSQCFVF